MPTKKRAMTASEMGRKGGPARAKALAPAERAAIAKQGAAAANGARSAAERKALAANAAAARWKK
jgi:hypothetical protein